MIVGRYYDGVELIRKEKIVVARLLRPHRALTSCRLNGGLRDDLEFIFNHQSCEPSNHIGTDLCSVAVGDPARYQKRIADKAGIAWERAAALGTAANMNNTAIACETFQDLQVTVVTTAGVGTNGARAGDPAAYYQSAEGVVRITGEPPRAGTINMMLFVSEELAAGAMVVVATLLAEAKASVLQELSAPSRYSEGLATGTGTDQIGIASLLNTAVRHTDANKHSKLGELIGRAARRSLQEALTLQSGLTPHACRSSIALLQRLGESQETFIRGVGDGLPTRERALFEANFLAVNHDPLTVAGVQALLHVRDQLVWGVLPLACLPEALLAQAAVIASAVAGRTLTQETFHAEAGALRLELEPAAVLVLARKAFALGFSRKWQGRFED